MEKPADKKAGSVTVAPGEAKIKMVQRHPGFIEPDVDAAQAETDENRFAGPNPYPPGSARAQGWEHLKNSQK